MASEAGRRARDRRSPFFNYGALQSLEEHGANRHWLICTKSTHAWRCRAKTLGPGEELVLMEPSRRTRSDRPKLHPSYDMRASQYQRAGFRPQILLTSLLDLVRYPAREIVALYHERWEIELGYDEVKTKMLERQEAIRSRKPRGVARQLWGVGLAYNLVRLEMIRTADEAGVPPNRISFVMALRLIRDEWAWATVTRSGAIPRHLRGLRAEVARLVLPPPTNRATLPPRGEDQDEQLRPQAAGC